ncbi:transposase [Tenacibaculum tangerinum]|uniref:Transposase n=1 Tax=Tenacibaculum tangerinum TaxID=3038772 RepID=A0ABY8KZ22_9FLAO|nr:transposase [Tenacibaculum tangerinum]WGH74486.1 transposase [Tenacibaculum tangerinum]
MKWFFRDKDYISKALLELLFKYGIGVKARKNMKNVEYIWCRCYSTDKRVLAKPVNDEIKLFTLKNHTKIFTK